MHPDGTLQCALFDIGRTCHELWQPCFMVQCTRHGSACLELVNSTQHHTRYAAQQSSAVMRHAREASVLQVVLAAMHSLSQQFVVHTTRPPVTCAAAHLTDKADAEPTAAVKLLQLSIGSNVYAASPVLFGRLLCMKAC